MNTPGQRRCASTFPDIETAGQCVAAALRFDAERVVEWITMPKGSYHLDIAMAFDEPIGTVAYKGQNDVQPAHRLRVILRRNPAMPHGYHVHTVKLT